MIANVIASFADDRDDCLQNQNSYWAFQKVHLARRNDVDDGFVDDVEKESNLGDD